MGKHIPKLERQKKIQEKQETELLLNQVIKQSNKLNRSFAVIIKEAIENRDKYENTSNDRFQFFSDFLIENAKNTKSDSFRGLIENLVFMSKKLEKKCPKWFKDTYFLSGLIEIARYSNFWIRPLERWKPRLKNEHQKFKELITFLFAEYDFPMFMNFIFFHKQDAFFIRDFIFLVQGGSIRSISSTIPLTNKMKVEFMKSPVGFRIFEAFRYAQVISLGGDELLAYKIAYSWLGLKEKRNEGFWELFIKILISGGEFDYDKIHELLDYVLFELNQDQSYSLKGRTFTSLLRNSDLWHKTTYRNQKVKELIVWQSIFAEPSELVEENTENAIEYKIVELLSNRELMEEGNRMNHCVGLYGHYCVKGKSRIVSLRKYQNGFEIERMATIQIDLPTRKVIQAKQRYNHPISEKTMSLMSRWTNKHELKINTHL